MREKLQAHLDHLVNYARCLTKNPEDARDIVQNCALKALVAKKVPSDERAFRAWLFKILRNTFLDELRRQTKHVSLLNELSRQSETEWNNPSDSGVYSIEQRKINILSVRQGMERLSVGHREILLLIDMLGFNYGESADILQIPVGTVMSRLSRARNALLEQIDEVGIGPVSLTDKVKA